MVYSEKKVILGAEFDPINIGVGVFQMPDDIRIWENVIKSCICKDRMSKKMNLSGFIEN